MHAVKTIQMGSTGLLVNTFVLADFFVGKSEVIGQWGYSDLTHYSMKVLTKKLFVVIGIAVSCSGSALAYDLNMPEQRDRGLVIFGIRVGEINQLCRLYQTGILSRDKVVSIIRIKTSLTEEYGQDKHKIKEFHLALGGNGGCPELFDF